MSATDEIVEQATPVQMTDASETKNRRRARSVVSEALRKSGSPLDNRGLTAHLLPGLWNAAMNVLIAQVDEQDIVALLTDRFRGIVGHGDNANSPLKQIPEAEAAAYGKRVAEAGATIMECLEPALKRLEDEGLDDRFPETVFDASLTVLLQAWGPDHVRRVIGEQGSLFLRGVFQPLNVKEPLNFLSPPQSRQPVQEKEPEAEGVKVPQTAAPAVPEPPRKRLSALRAQACICADMSEAGFGAWAVSINFYGDESGEERIMWGKVADSNGRASWMKGMHECVLAICAAADRVSAEIEVGDEFLKRGLDGNPGSRLETEERQWSDIDAAMAVHDITVVYRDGSLTRPEVEKCRRKIQFVISEP